MARRPNSKLDQYSEKQLEEALYLKRYAERKNRLTRLKDEGRVVDVPVGQNDGKPGFVVTSAQRALGSEDESADVDAATTGRWGNVFNRSLLFVEIAAAIGFIWIVYSLVGSLRQLNSEITQAQQDAIANAPVIATPTLSPVIDLVLLPSGHQPPVEGQPIIYEEAGSIPSHLLPLVDAYVPPPIPTAAPEQPRQIQITKIAVNAPIFAGHEEEQLKKGVGHSIGTALVGDVGNMVLSAHNDIYGEIFRNLDQLESGDEIVVSSGRANYTYVVNNIEVVLPTAVEVMAPTDHASLTLISCYPYLIDNKRIIVKADLKETDEDQS